MSFLDKTGLAHLWQKIRGYDPNPIKGAITEEAYNALTDEEKASGSWAIIGDAIGGSGEGSSEQIYSTEEVRIGKWIDGKPLYRRVFTEIKSGNTADLTNVLSLTPYDINADNVVSINGWLLSAANMKIFFNTASPNWICRAITRGYTSGNCIAVQTNDGSQYNCPCTIILEYTKTTD